MIITWRILMIKTIITIKALRRLLRFPASPKATFGNIEPSLDRYRHHELIAGDSGWGRGGGEDVTDPPVDQEEV